jgi:hypothetical protein
LHTFDANSDTFATADPDHRTYSDTRTYANANAVADYSTLERGFNDILEYG